MFHAYFVCLKSLDHHCLVIPLSSIVDWFFLLSHSRLVLLVCFYRLSIWWYEDNGILIKKELKYNIQFVLLFKMVINYIWHYSIFWAIEYRLFCEWIGLYFIIENTNVQLDGKEKRNPCFNSICAKYKYVIITVLPVLWVWIVASLSIKRLLFNFTFIIINTIAFFINNSTTISLRVRIWHICSFFLHLLQTYRKVKNMISNINGITFCSFTFFAYHS